MGTEKQCGGRDIFQEDQRRLMSDPMEAPLIASGMDRLAKSDTIAIRQLTQYAEAFLPFDQQNKYVFSEVPQDVRAATSQEDSKAWHPTGNELRRQPAFFLAYEQSDFWTRCLYMCIGCANQRPFDMNFITTDKVKDLNAAGWSNVQKNRDIKSDGDGFRLQRPFKCGGICNEPFELSVLNGDGKPLGAVRENFAPYGEKCHAQCCECTNYHDLFMEKGGMEKPLYTLVVNRACCGPHNNCCGATCLKENMIFPILNGEGETVAHIQKLYAKEDEGCLGAFCRMSSKFSNYIVSFPSGSSQEEKQLIMGGLMQIEYVFFTRKMEIKPGV